MRNRIFISLVIAFVILFNIGCKDNSTGTEYESDLEFSKMEIHYTHSGGWINTSKLYIYGDGRVNAYQIKHASHDTLNSSYVFIDEEEQNKLEDLFESFSAYDYYYGPEIFVTDQDYYTTVLIYEDKVDTVDVYMPEQANIPDELEEIIHEMKTLWVVCSSLFE
jgi:hypothetical protein